MSLTDQSKTALLSKLRAPVADEQKPVAKLRFGSGDGMPSILSWNSRPAGTYLVYDAPAASLETAAEAVFVLPDVLPELTTDGGAQYVSMATVQTVLRAARAALASAPADDHDKEIDEALKERDDREEIIDKLLDLVLGEDRPEWSSAYDYGDALIQVEDHMHALSVQASAPVAKPKRAPLDDWRVQAIAECLEAEWDYMTPDQAEADARLIVGYMIEYEKESDRIEAQHASEPVHPVVQAVRNLRASAPVADEQLRIEFTAAGVGYVSIEKARAAVETARMASAPVAGEANPVGRVRHFNYAGVARNGFSQEAVLNDDAPSLPDGTLLYASPQASEAVRDAALFDWLLEETCDLRCINVPTGGDDYEVRWIVVAHHMSEPHEREIARSFTDDPRDAIRAALSAQPGAQMNGGGDAE